MIHIYIDNETYTESGIRRRPLTVVNIRASRADTYTHARTHEHIHSLIFIGDLKEDCSRAKNMLLKINLVNNS